MKKILSLTIMVTIISLFSYVSFEPETVGAATTASSATSVNLTVDAAISLSASTSSLQLVGSIDGLTGGTATGSVTYTVITNNSGGYTLKSSKTDLLKTGAGGTSSTEFMDISSSMSYGFPTSSLTGFGVTITSGADAIDDFKNSGSSCGSGTIGGNCWTAVPSSPSNVATSASPTSGSGTATTLGFEALAGTNNMLTSGSYSVTVTTTAAVQ